MAAVGGRNLLARPQAYKGKGWGKGKTTDPSKLYAVTNMEYMSVAKVGMYPDKDMKKATKPIYEGGPLLEDATGPDLLRGHKAAVIKGSKSVEEIHRAAIGVSENASSLLALLNCLQEQERAPVPILNLAVCTALKTMLEQFQTALSILDISVDVPRSENDINDALNDWLSLGDQLNQAHFGAILASFSKVLPYLSNGVYRCRILQGIASSAALSHECVTKHETRGGPAWQAWATSPGDDTAMWAWFADCFRARWHELTHGFLPAAAEANPDQTAQDAALAAFLAQGAAGVPAVAPRRRAAAAPAAAPGGAAAAPPAMAVPGAAAPAAGPPRRGAAAPVRAAPGAAAAAAAGDVPVGDPVVLGPQLRGAALIAAHGLLMGPVIAAEPPAAFAAAPVAAPKTEEDVAADAVEAKRAAKKAKKAAAASAAAEADPEEDAPEEAAVAARKAAKRAKKDAAAAEDEPEESAPEDPVAARKAAKKAKKDAAAAADAVVDQPKAKKAR